METVSFESALITSIIDNRDIKTVIKQKITSDFFFDPVNKAAYTFLLQWYNNPDYTDVPSWQSFADSFQSFEPARTEDSLVALCDKLRQQKLYGDIATVLQEVGEETAGDPLAGFEKLKKQVVTLAEMHNVDESTSFKASLGELRDEYLAMKEGLTKLKGFEYPWPALNDATLGLQRGHLVFVYGRPKVCKCIPLDEPVLSADGTFTTIEHLQRSVTLDHETLRWTEGEVVGHTKPQMMECFEVETETGYRARLGTTHPMLRPDLEYTPCGQLKVGDYVGVARELPAFGKAEDGYEPGTAELLGLLIGDGNYTRAEIQSTSQDAEVVARLAELAEPWGCHLNQGSRTIEYRLVRDEAEKHNGILGLLRQEGIHGSKGMEKHLPARIFRSGREAALAMLGGLLTTDGCVSKGAVSWATSSEQLARQLKHLLLRIGVVGCIHEGHSYTGPSYNVMVQSQEQFERLLPMLPYVSLEYKASGILALATKEIRRKRHNDGVPWSAELEAAIHAARPAAANGWKGGGWGDMPWKFNTAKLFRRTGVISRALLRQLASALKAPRLLRWADSPVRWERITSIRPLGRLLTADAGVVDHHNFLVGDMVTHNTWILLEIARVLHANGIRILIESQELSDIEIKRRFVALCCNVNYTQFLRGMLSDEQEAAFFDALESLEAQEDFVVSQLEPGEKCITDLQAQIDEYKPDVVLVDSVNYISADWKELAVVLRGFKRTCKAKMIPLVATTHANRSRDKKTADLRDEGSDFAYGDAFYQVADLALRLTSDIEDKKARQVKAFTAAIREGQQALFTINVRLCEDLTQKSVEQFCDEATDVDEQMELDGAADLPDEQYDELGGEGTKVGEL